MVSIHILGSAQDGGIPHLGCDCFNCMQNHRLVASLGIDSGSHRLIIDATPDIQHQIRSFGGLSQINAIFLTHLHIGHYTGLLQLGKEVASTTKFPVYMTATLAEFIQSNKPFSYLVDRDQISIRLIIPGEPITFDSCTITAFEVPHRNEDGNTVGYMITNTQNNKNCIYIPDIDFLDKATVQKIQMADLVILDGSFFSNDELPHFSQVPHPPILSTIKQFSPQSLSSFYFTHFNHSNPILHDIKKQEELQNQGFNLVHDGQIIDL